MKPLKPARPVCMPKVNPSILVWARETAGLDAPEAATKLGFKGSQLAVAAERLLALEAGMDEPSRSMLVRMAKLYRRPLVAFYLAEPPRPRRRGSDFRTLPDGPHAREEAILDALLRDIRARQSLIRSILEDDEDAEPMEWVGSKSRHDEVANVVSAVRNQLGITAGQVRQMNSSEDLFRVLRERVESAGVFVLLVGSLGSHHTAVDVDTFRGFAIADPLAPFIVINDNDAKTAWSFTLIHEFVHLLLGQTGVSGGVPDRRIEKFCNDVASEILLPTDELRAVAWPARGSEVDELQELIQSFAEQRKVSSLLIAYKLFRNGLITQEAWLQLRSRFRRSWIDQKDRERELRPETATGPSYYVVKRHRLGRALLETAARMMAAGSLSTTKAGTVLGVRAKNVRQLVSGFGSY